MTGPARTHRHEEGRRAQPVVEIRAAIPADARALLALKRVLDRETSFMLLEPDERTTSEPEMAEELRSIEARPNAVVLVAEAGGELAGYAEATGGAFRRNRHAAYVVIGVRHSNAGRGVGRRLLIELERWALSSRVLRLELTVMTSNERAINLYRKLAYQVEGRRRAALLVRNELVDEFWMAQRLGTSPP